MAVVEAEIKEYIERKLGKGVIKVELTNDQLNDAIGDAKRYWQMWVGQAKGVIMTLTTDTEYDKSLIASDVDSVVDVAFDLDNDTFSNIFAWADVQVNMYDWLGASATGGYQFFGAGGGYSALVQYMQYVEQAKQIVSADRDWEWDDRRDRLLISPKPEAGRKIFVLYMSTNVELDYLTRYEIKLFRDYALAQAMKTLAFIRMKYADKPSATGSFAMDGDALWANAEAMEDKIEEKMRSVQEPVAFWAE